MSLVAAETEVQFAPPATKKEDEKWEELPIYMAGFERVCDEAVIDVMKMFTRSSKIKSVQIPSISNITMREKDGVMKDPYNLRKINNLAYHYLREGQHEMALNVLMRGWKRAGEITDEIVRLRFLMKVCELSFGYWKYKQALAVFRDISEPSDPKHRKSYLLLGTQVWSSNGDLQQGLKFFQRCIDGEPLQVATRTLAVTVLELKKAGAFEAAKSTVENLAGINDHADIMLISEFAECAGDNKKVLSRGMNEQRNMIIAAVTVSMFFLMLMLYWLESRSLAAMDWTAKSK